MFPWGHAAVGYLLFVGVSWYRDRALPHGSLLGVLLVATQLPDLVDKPLAYYGVLVSGRSLGHSVFTAAVLIIVAVALGRRFDAPRHARAFAVGHGSHLLGDSYVALLAGNWDGYKFLFYPVVPPIDYPQDTVPPWIRLLRVEFTPRQTFQLALVAIALALYVYSVVRRRRRARAG